MQEKILNAISGQEELRDYRVKVTVDPENIVTLEGEVDQWQQVVDIGHIAGSFPEVKNVRNLITVKGLELSKADYTKQIAAAKEKGTLLETEVLIIGAGVTGCAIARALSRYQLKVAVTELHDDVCMGASKANSGAVHPGHMAKPGTLKAKLNVRGNAMYTDWARELNFTLRRRGSLGVAYEEYDGKVLEKIHAAAQANGVPGCRFLTPEELHELEPDVPGEPCTILYNPTWGAVEPYEVVTAVADSAAKNGVKFLLGNPVFGIQHSGEGGFSVYTKKGVITTQYIIDAAGVHADDIAEMAGDCFYTLHARRGTIPIFDKSIRYPYSRGVGTVSRTANKESKGGGCGPTPEGNIQSGPSATETPWKDDTATYPKDLDYAMERAYATIKELTPGDVITFFTGVRAADYKEDFIIEMSKKVPGFIHVAGIQSPGLAAAPAVAEMVEGILLDDRRSHGEEVLKNPDYDPYLPPKVEFRNRSREEQDELIRKDPRYGRVICRCETITEGEILDAIHSPIVPTSVDAIKRRTRAGMGRCQGGFCQQKIVELLARELGQEWVDINLKDDGSYILREPNRRQSGTEPAKEGSEMKQMPCDLAVIGGGPAGLAAAVEAKRQGVDRVVVIERDIAPGGILRQCVHDGFGLHRFGQRMTGGQYAQAFIDQAVDCGVEFLTDTMVLEVTPDRRVYAVGKKTGMLELSCGAVILAMGCRERTRSQVFLYGTRPSGVMTAGAAQRYINIDGYLPGKRAVILGSGDIGLIMARRMTLEGMEVEGVYEVMPNLGGLRRNAVQCLEDYDIPLHLSTTVTWIHGEKRLEGVTVSQVDAQRKPIPGTERYIPCDLLVLAVGLIPENELSKQAGIQLDPVTKGPVVDESCMTSVEGIFAAGNVAAVFDLVDYVSQTGEQAARGAAKYLAGRLDTTSPYLALRPGENTGVILPQRVRPTNLEGEALPVFLRVTTPIRNSTLECTGTDGAVACRRRYPVALPPEMLCCEIPKEKITSALTISVKEAVVG